MKSFDPSLVRAEMKIDSARFNLNYGEFTDTNVSEDELALLAFVKGNSGEAYGVEAVSKARAKRRAAPGLANQIECILTDEERYHARLLVGAAGHFRVMVGALGRGAAEEVRRHAFFA